MQGYSTLGSQWLMRGYASNPVLDSAVVGGIAAEAGRDAAQVVLRWALQHGQVCCNALWGLLTPPQPLEPRSQAQLVHTHSRMHAQGHGGSVLQTWRSFLAACMSTVYWRWCMMLALVRVLGRQ